MAVRDGMEGIGFDTRDSLVGSARAAGNGLRFRGQNSNKAKLTRIAVYDEHFYARNNHNSKEVAWCNCYNIGFSD